MRRVVRMCAQARTRVAPQQQRFETTPQEKVSGDSEEDAFAAMLPGLAKLTPEKMKMVAGHMHLIMEYGFPSSSFTWKIAEDYGSNQFAALGHTWQLGMELTRLPELNLKTETINGGTMRRYTLVRLSDGHPIPVQAHVVLKDVKGGTRTHTSVHYSPMQRTDELVGYTEMFEVLRVDETDDDVKEERLDVENVAELEVTLRIYPGALTELMDVDAE